MLALRAKSLRARPLMFAMAIGICLITTGAQAEEISVDSDVSLESLGYCSPKIDQVKGVFGPICRQLISSSDFRRVCATIKPENRIKCDGSEPDVTAKAADAESLKACVPHVYEGVKAGVKETAELAASAVEIAWDWVKQGTQSVFWDIEATGEATSAPASDKTSALDADTDTNTIAKADENSPRVIVSDDTAAYAAQAAADESERVDWFKVILMPEFWTLLTQEIKETLIESAQGFACLKPELQNEAVCEQIGQWVVGPKLVGLAGKFLKATTAAARSKLGGQVASLAKSSVKTTDPLAKYSVKKSMGAK